MTKYHATRDPKPSAPAALYDLASEALDALHVTGEEDVYLYPYEPAVFVSFADSAEELVDGMLQDYLGDDENGGEADIDYDALEDTIQPHRHAIQVLLQEAILEAYGPRYMQGRGVKVRINNETTEAK
jgi:hypothetical protein